jgi:hypothetical protein
MGERPALVTLAGAAMIVGGAFVSARAVSRLPRP